MLGKNGLPIFSRKTDADGRATFPTFKDFTREKTPTVYVAQSDGDFSFLPYQRNDRQLNLSRFDTGGLYTQGETGVASGLPVLRSGHLSARRRYPHRNGRQTDGLEAAPGRIAARAGRDRSSRRRDPEPHDQILIDRTRGLLDRNASRILRPDPTTSRSTSCAMGIGRRCWDRPRCASRSFSRIE